jgi:hypothetical protein
MSLGLKLNKTFRLPSIFIAKKFKKLLMSFK